MVIYTRISFTFSQERKMATSDGGNGPVENRPSEPPRRNTAAAQRTLEDNNKATKKPDYRSILLVSLLFALITGLIGWWSGRAEVSARDKRIAILAASDSIRQKMGSALESLRFGATGAARKVANDLKKSPADTSASRNVLVIADQLDSLTSARKRILDLEASNTRLRAAAKKPTPRKLVATARPRSKTTLKPCPKGTRLQPRSQVCIRISK